MSEGIKKKKKDKQHEWRHRGKNEHDIKWGSTASDLAKVEGILIE